MSEWQRIETAPRHDRAKYGSTNQPRVIAWDGADVYEARNWDCGWYRGDREVKPTHWQPLPPPPGQS